MLTAAYPAISYRFIQCEGHRRRRRVAMTIDGDDQSLLRHSESLCDGVQDADVRLMRNQPVEAVGVEAGLLQDVERRRTEHVHRELEHGWPVHRQEGTTLDASIRHPARSAKDAGLAAV